MTASKSPKELAKLLRGPCDLLVALDCLSRIEEATADVAEIRREHEQDEELFAIDQPRTEIEKLHNIRGLLLDIVAKQALQLTVSREVTDKTAIEVQAQAQVLRVAMALENPDLLERIRQIAEEAGCFPVKRHRVADEVVGLLRTVLNPKAKP